MTTLKCHKGVLLRQRFHTLKEAGALLVLSKVLRTSDKPRKRNTTKGDQIREIRLQKDSRATCASSSSFNLIPCIKSEYRQSKSTRMKGRKKMRFSMPFPTTLRTKTKNDSVVPMIKRLKVLQF